MKRLLVLTIVSVFAASSGCSRWSSRGAPCNPCVPVQPACGGGIETYSTQGTITTVPTLTPSQGIPMQMNPGPETYTPAQ